MPTNETLKHYQSKKKPECKRKTEKEKRWLIFRKSKIKITVSALNVNELNFHQDRDSHIKLKTENPHTNLYNSHI